MLPIWPVWVFYALRLIRPTWFTAVNPAMEDSGFMGESKYAIYKLIPKSLQPVTQFISVRHPFSEPVFSYPFIVKPDIGGRGRKLKVINTIQELKEYHLNVGEDYLIQEIVHHPLEIGVFYVRMPQEAKGKVVSLVSKDFLSVRGDGMSSVRELMQKDVRARQQIHRLAGVVDMDNVPFLGEEVVLESIGNHCRGTKFINENNRISPELNAVMDNIGKQIPGFYYGRFDIRVPSWKDLYAGKDISIIELNGLTADPAHIFDADISLAEIYKTQFRHVRWAYRIARENLKNGAKTTPPGELLIKTFRALRNM